MERVGFMGSGGAMDEIESMTTGVKEEIGAGEATTGVATGRRSSSFSSSSSKSIWPLPSRPDAKVKEVL